MLVKVEQRHIDEGIPGDPCFCPIAQSIKETVNKEIYVIGTTIRIDGYSYHTPINAHRFLRDFDSGLKVTPISFYLQLKD